MRHTITLSSNPRMVVLILLVLILPAVGVLLLIFAGIVIGILALAGAAYLDYTILRFLRNHLKSWVEASEEQLRCRMPDGEMLVFPWKQVTVAGYCIQEQGRPFVFVYRDEEDKLVTIPEEYNQFETLLSSIKQRTPFEELSLAKGETIQDRLKVMLKIESSEEAGDQESGENPSD